MRKVVVFTQTLVLISVFTFSAVFIFHNFIQENPINISGDGILGDSIERQKNNIEKSLNVDLKNNTLGSTYLEGNSPLNSDQNPLILLESSTFMQAKFENNQVSIETIYKAPNSIQAFKLFDNKNLFYISKIDPFGDQQLVITNLESKEQPIVIDLEPTSVQVYSDIYFDTQSKSIWILSLTREGKYNIQYVNTKFEIVDFTQIETDQEIKFIGIINNQINFQKGHTCIYLDEENKVVSEIKCVNKLSPNLEYAVYRTDEGLDIFDLQSKSKTTINLVSPNILSIKNIDNNLYIHLANEIVIYYKAENKFERINLIGNYLQETFTPVKTDQELLFLNLQSNTLYRAEGNKLSQVESDKKTASNIFVNKTIPDSSILIFSDK